MYSRERSVGLNVMLELSILMTSFLYQHYIFQFQLHLLVDIGDISISFRLLGMSPQPPVHPSSHRLKVLGRSSYCVLVRVVLPASGNEIYARDRCPPAARASQ